MSTVNKKLLGFMFNGSALNLAGAAWKGNLNTIYGFNAAGTGFTSFKPTSNFNSLTQLQPDGVYIVDAKTTGFDIPGALLTLASLSGGSSSTDIFYELIGQSNADGQARANELPAGYTGALTNCYIYTPFTGAFAQLQGGVNSATAGGDSWGLEVSMLPALAAHFGGRVNLSKYAVPGTQLAASSGQDWAVSATGEYYDLSNANTTAARAALGSHPVPAAIIWDQGESDANSTYADQYEANLTAFIAAKRAYYGSAVPFLIVQLSTAQTFLDASFLAKLRQAQANVCQKVAGCELINTDDLPLDGPKLHYIAPGLITLGERIATKLIALAGTPTSTGTLAPLVTGDDLANTLTVTHRYGVAGTEAQVNGGAWLAYTIVPGYSASTGKIEVGNVNRVAGYYQFRTAADAGTGRTASAAVSSPAFTVVSTTQPTNLLTVTNLADAAWNPGDMLALVAGQADAAGGTSAVLARPNTSSTDNHSLHSNALAVVTNGSNYGFSVEALPAGYRYVSLLVLNEGFTLLGQGLFDTQTGTVVSSSVGTATCAALAGGWCRPKVAFTANSGQVYLFVKLWGDATQTTFAGNGTSGLKLANPILS